MTGRDVLGIAVGVVCFIGFFMFLSFASNNCGPPDGRTYSLKKEMIRACGNSDDVAGCIRSLGL